MTENDVVGLRVQASVDRLNRALAVYEERAAAGRVTSYEHELVGAWNDLVASGYVAALADRDARIEAALRVGTGSDERVDRREAMLDILAGESEESAEDDYDESMDECPACDTPPSRCSKDDPCCEDCTHSDNWPPVPAVPVPQDNPEPPFRSNPEMPSDDQLHDWFGNAGGDDWTASGLRAVWRAGCDAGMIAESRQGGPEQKCAHCGKRFTVGGALIRDNKTFPLCHPDEGLDCYRLVTVYGEPVGSRRGQDNPEATRDTNGGKP